MTKIFLYSNLFIMKLEDIIEFKKQLEEEAGELELKIKSFKKMPEFGSDTETDFSEEADEAEEFSEKIGETGAYKERLADIELALDKISRNEYGKCEKCGNEIEMQVLKVNPESRLCKNCKQK